MNPNHPKVSGVFESQNIENPFMKQEAEYMNDNLKAGIIEVIHITRANITNLLHYYQERKRAVARDMDKFEKQKTSTGDDTYIEDNLKPGLIKV